MNHFSRSVFEELIKVFPEWAQYQRADAAYLEIVIPAGKGASIGGLIIQTTEDDSIWVRTYQPCSGYPVDTVVELVSIVRGVFDDRILWVTGFREEEWIETTLTKDIQELKTESGMTYKLLSWSGIRDSIIAAGE